MNYDALTATAFRIATQIESAAIRTEEFLRTVDHLYVQPMYEMFGDYLKNDALSDIATLIAYCIVYANKIAVWAGEPDRVAQMMALENAKTSEIIDPTMEVIPMAIAAPIVYALPDVFQPQETIVEVGNDPLTLDELKAIAKELKVKGWNMYRSPEKLQAAIDKKVKVIS